MDFKQFNKVLQQQFELLTKAKLFRVKVTGQEIWDTYLGGFSRENDPVFRDPASTTHTCNNDKNFIRRYGNIVAIIDGKVVSMFDVNVEGTIYEDSVKAVKNLIESSIVENVFFETFTELNILNYEKTKKDQPIFQLGNTRSLKVYTQDEADKFGVVTPGPVYEFHHFHVFLPTSFVDKGNSSVEAIMAGYRDAKNVFQRGMQEITLEALQTVSDLINQGSILNAESHLDKVQKFIGFKKEFDLIPNALQDNWCWVKSFGLPYAKFRNELVGTLCTDISNGVDLNEACLTWNKRADPANYMKALAPITNRQKEEAEKFVVENGYVESFDRSFANIDDISMSDITHMNIGTKTKSAGLFKDVKTSSDKALTLKEFDKVETVSIDKFMSDILPNTSSVEILLENRFNNNFVALTKAATKDSKPLFKWNNNFAWTYIQNLTGKSEIKEAVKTAGGKVDGVLRFSIMWADGNGDNSDLDAHCIEPSGNEIYFSNKVSSKTRGNLDIDITQPGGRLAVENITHPELIKLQNGTYKFFVHQFSARSSKGFKAEIEFNGEIFQYEYNRPVSGNVDVAYVTFNNGQFTIEHKLQSSSLSKEIWGVETGKFQKVNLMCPSPNHWADNNVGNKHYFFMLENCHVDIPLRSFHNEFLTTELLQYRKQLEALSASRMISPSGKDLSGIGFNATVRDTIILKLSGTHNRVIKVTI